MPKRRKVEVNPRLLEKVEDLRRRMRETDREIETALAMADRFVQKVLRLSAGR
ncbi:MAG: hypothetical protein ACRDKS_00765 [Actinomycetota bacterium]